MTSRLLLALAALAISSASLHAAPPDSFLGKWYTKPKYEGHMFRRDVIVELEILPDQTYAMKVLLVHEADGEKTVFQHALLTGTYAEEGGHLVCQEEKSSFLLIKNSEGHLEFKRPESGKTIDIFLPPSQAPWSHYKIVPALKQE